MSKQLSDVAMQAQLDQEWARIRDCIRQLSEDEMGNLCEALNPGDPLEIVAGFDADLADAVLGLARAAFTQGLHLAFGPEPDPT